MRFHMSFLLLTITMVGWACTFIALVRQFSANQLLLTEMDFIFSSKASKTMTDAFTTKVATTAEKEISTKETLKDQGASYLRTQRGNAEYVDGDVPMSTSVLKSLSSTWMELRNNIMELQYFLNRRRKGWNPRETQFMEDLVKYLWTTVHSSREKLIDRECTKTLRLTSKDLLKHLEKVQHKRDCHNKHNKLAVCDARVQCGLGCQLHHIAWCFILSVSLNRTMVLDDTNWMYSRTAGWSEFFLPVSSCKLPNGTRKIQTIRGEGEDLFLAHSRFIRIPTAGQLRRLPPLNGMPPNIPEKWAKNVLHCHSNPIVWYISHFVHYVSRPNENLMNHVNDVINRYRNLSSNYFGLHVRRADKITEAPYHDLKEYMSYVEVIRRKFENTSLEITNDIYLATDEPKVLMNEASNFTHFNFFGNSRVASLASNSALRHLEGNAIWVITDVLILSKSQYLVCTFSSNLCRLAYELMQFERRTEDASWRCQSLDDSYYFTGSGRMYWYAASDHKAPRKTYTNMELSPVREISLRHGEQLFLHGNHWDGYSKVMRVDPARSRVGVVPSFKMRRSALGQNHSNDSVWEEI